MTKYKARVTAAAVEVGTRYGRLTVIGEAVKGADGSYVPCMCDCGRPVFRLWGELNTGRTSSCGCRAGNHRHGGRSERLYNIWHGMRGRCNNEAHPAYANYGARGVYVCVAWQDDYAVFRAWAREHGYDDALTLERVDNDGPYAPENCRWVPLAEQARNRRSCVRIVYDGEERNLTDWARDPRCQVGYHTLRTRLRAGWTFETALLTPVWGREVSS